MDKKNRSSTLLFVLLVAFLSPILTYSAPIGSAQTLTTSPTFTIRIVASINNYSSTCVLGVNPDSSINYSSKYDSYASYPNSGGVYAYFRYNNPTTFRVDKLSQYTVPSNGSTTWHLEVESIDQEGILTINWSSGTAFGSLTFEDGIINQIVYADMNAVSNFSYRATSGGVSDFDIVYQSATAATPTPTQTADLSPTSNSSPIPSPTSPSILATATPITSSNIIASPSPTPTTRTTMTPLESSTQQPTSTQTAEPFPIPLLIATVIVVVIVTVALVVLIILGLLRSMVKSKKAKS